MIKEYGAFVDIDEEGKEASPHRIDNVVRKCLRTIKARPTDLPTRDYGFAFAHSSEGHLHFVCSLAYSDKIVLPILEKRLTKKGYTDILVLNSATLLDMACRKMAI